MSWWKRFVAILEGDTPDLESLREEREEARRDRERASAETTEKTERIVRGVGWNPPPKRHDEEMMEALRKLGTCAPKDRHGPR